MEYSLLLGCFPHRQIERKVLLSQFREDEAKAYAAKVLTRMEDNGYVRKRVIWENGRTECWRTTTYDRATRLNRDRGYVVMEITVAGVSRLLAISQLFRHPEMLDYLPIEITGTTAWGRGISRTDASNKNRKQQAILWTLHRAGVKTILDRRACRPPCSNAPTAAAKSISEAICVRAAEISAQPDLNRPTSYYEKLEISKSKNFVKDNIIGVVISDSAVIPIYHTNSYYGTIWLRNSKPETITVLKVKCSQMGYGYREITKAMMFTSSPKEFADIIRSSHKKEVNTRRPFLGYRETSASLNNIADPFAALYAIPEENDTPEMVARLLKDPTQEDWEQQFSNDLEAAIPNAFYNELTVLQEYAARNGAPSVFTLPEEVSERSMFTKGSFPFGVVLSQEPTSPVYPVFLGYDMNLVEISRLFCWVYETTLIGTKQNDDAVIRNILIACYPWQVKWYKKLFPDVMYLADFADTGMTAETDL